MKKHIVGLILSGGKNRRMNGRKKAFLDWNGKPFFAWEKEALGWLPEVKISVESGTDCQDTYQKTGMEPVRDHYPQCGPLGAVCSGMEEIKAEALLVLPCDVPNIKKETLKQLAACYENTGSLVIIRAGGRLQPLIGVYPVRYLPVFQQMLRGGSYRMMDLLSRVPYKVTEASEEECENINTPEDYRMLTERKKIPLEEALKRIENRICRVRRKKETRILDAVGCVLAQDLRADMDQPPFRRAVMDGYAILAEKSRGASKNSPVSFQVTREVTAGDVPVRLLPEQEAAAKAGGGRYAVRIMTGAPVPEDADCVVRQEDTDYGEDTMRLFREYEAGEFCSEKGEDYHRGDLLIKSGTRIGALEAGLAASAGRESLCVWDVPRIALFTTGDELAEPGEVLENGKIYNGNKYMIWARLSELGVPPCITERLPDAKGCILKRIQETARKVDFIITTGGVSVGKKDLMEPVLKQLGAEEIFRGVDVRPGGPVMLHLYEGKPVLSLSGNPGGAAVHLELLGRKVLAVMTGEGGFLAERREAELLSGYPKASPVRRMVYGIYRDGNVYLPEGPGFTGTMSGMKGCNCLIDIEAGSGPVQAGSKVKVVLL